MSLNTETNLILPEYEISMWVPPINSDYIDLLEEEKIKAGLSSTKISLLVPEVLLYDDGIGFTSGNKEAGYTICYNPSVKLSIDLNARAVIKHELAHIKFGDVDLLNSIDQSKLPFKEAIWRMYYHFIAEPRAWDYSGFPNIYKGNSIEIY